jgi:hypothetical protein
MYYAAAAPAYHETTTDTDPGLKKFDFLASHRLASVELEAVKII